MQGKILDYSSKENSGIIAGNDGEKYTFTDLHWHENIEPKNNTLVDFVIVGQEATEIYIEKSTQATETCGFAITSLVLGIFWVWGIGSLLAIVFGHLSLSNIKKSNGSKSGKGLALAGLILGYIGVIGTIVGFYTFMYLLSGLGHP